MQEEIAILISNFCDEKLDDEYKKLCMKALRKLNPASGTPRMWAAGIVYAIAQNSFLTGNRYDLIVGKPKYHLETDEVAAFFSISKGGMAGKAKSIRDELRMNPNQEAWMTTERKNDETRKAIVLMRSMLKL